MLLEPDRTMFNLPIIKIIHPESASRRSMESHMVAQSSGNAWCLALSPAIVRSATTRRAPMFSHPLEAISSEIQKIPLQFLTPTPLGKRLRPRGNLLGASQHLLRASWEPPGSFWLSFELLSSDIYKMMQHFDLVL